MTVGQLIRKLQVFDENMQVAVSRDEEGNGFSGYVEPEEDHGIVVIWPSGFGELDELDDYVPDEEDE